MNIPQLLVFVILSVLAVRWYLSKPSTAGTRPQAQHRAGRAISPAQIDQVAAVFPQLDRRDIAWDLSRNGGNVTATTEKVLSTGRLDHVSLRRADWTGCGIPFADGTAGTGIIPASTAATTALESCVANSHSSHEAVAARSDNAIQPLFETGHHTRAGVRGEGQTESVVTGQRRAAFKPRQKAGGDDSCRAAEDGGEREGQSFERIYFIAHQHAFNQSLEPATRRHHVLRVEQFLMILMVQAQTVFLAITVGAYHPT